MRLSPKMLAALAALPAVCLMTPGCSTANVQSASKKADAASVTVATVTRKDDPVEVRGIGNVEAYAATSGKPQIGGELPQAYSQEGDTVRKGTFVFPTH